MKPYQDTAYWFSKISNARDCLRKYQLKHIDKVVIEGPKQGDLEFGTAIHAALNDILEGGDGVGLFGIYWDSMLHEKVEYGRYKWAELNDMGPPLLERFIRIHQKKFKPYKMEERMFVKLGDTDYEGTPDFLGDFEGIPSVVDFKTAGYRYDSRKILCDEQMPGYALMAKEAYGYEAKQLVYVVLIKSSTKPDIQIIKTPLTNDISRAIMINIDETTSDLKDRKSFPRNPSSCIRGSIVCPYLATCFGETK